MLVNSDQINAEYENLLSCWSNIDFCKVSRQTLKLNECIKNNSSKNDIKNRIRKFHDIFGLKAHKQISFNANDPSNLCSGSFYRTSKFINIKLKDRFFENKSHKKIHIEHTIPVEEIYNQILIFQKFKNPNDLTSWLLNNSIATAFNYKQANNCKFPNEYLIIKGYHSKSNVFNTKSPDFNKPFRRYALVERNEEIWDVLNKRTIDPNKFTLQDHKKNILIIKEKLNLKI